MSRLFILTIVLCWPFLAGADALERVRDWSHAALSAELDAEDPDLNLVSSITYPLVEDVRLTGNPQSFALAARVREHLALLDPADLDCARLPDALLIAGFMGEDASSAMAEVGTDRLPECLQTNSLFDLANSLIFLCGHSALNHASVLPGGLQRLAEVKREDGAFIAETGREWFYLTTHGMLALHLCGGAPEAVARSRARLEERLGLLQRNGMLDGLAEALMFLRLTGDPAAEEAAYLGWLMEQSNPDGGICLRRLPGCASHWHAASLLYRLLLEVAAEPGSGQGA